MDNPPVRRLADWEAEHLRDLADEHGTPLYVIDLDRVRQNASRLRQAFPRADVAYAVKANTVRPVLEALADADVGAECAAAGEVRRALAAGFPGDRVRYTAVNPPDRDLDAVVEAAADEDVVVTVGALDTLDRLAERGYDGRLWVRVNPGVGAGHHEKVSTGAEPKFGIPHERAGEAVAYAADEYGYEVTGLHAHVGSGVSGEDLAAHRAMVERLGALAVEVPADLSVVSVGGGFGVPYRESDEPLDLGAVAEATRTAFADGAARARGEPADGTGAPPARLAVEPGRYVVADAGVLLTSVNTVKPTPDAHVVGVDAGMTTLLRPAMYGAYHAVRSLEPDAPRRDSRTVELSGPVCETADVLGRDRTLPDPTRGDLLAIGNAGAYGYEMASNYNSRPRPAVVTLRGTTGAGDPAARLAVRRETLADLTRLEEP